MTLQITAIFWFLSRWNRFALASLALALFIASGLAAPAPAASPTNPPSITTGPVLQSPTETTVTITWITDRATTATVEFGPTNGELKTAFASQDGLIQANARIHQVMLDNLRPGTVYRYRVVSRDIVNFRHYKIDFGETVASDFFQFRTLDRRQHDYSFIVFNDVHGQAGTFPELLKVAGGRPYDFVVLNGDILSYVESESQVTAILDQLQISFATATPFFWVRGNHETRGKLARDLPAYIGRPGGRYYYSFDHGPVHFVVLDAGEDKIDEHKEYGGLVDFFRYRQQQGEWLKQEVRTAAFRNAKYRVVLVHMPFASAKAADPKRTKEPTAFLGMSHAFEQFGRTLDRAKVHLMISGHTHTPAIIPPEPGRHRYPILQGGGDKGTNRTVIRVEVSKTGLTGTMLRPDGTIAGTCQVPAKR